MFPVLFCFLGGEASLVVWVDALLPWAPVLFRLRLFPRVTKLFVHVSRVSNRKARLNRVRVCR